MATPVPHRWIAGLPTEAQREIERNFAHLQSQITAGVSSFDAVVNADLTSSNAAAHQYKNFTDLAANETWAAGKTFVVGLISAAATCVDSAIVDITGKGHITIIGQSGYQQTTAVWFMNGLKAAPTQSILLRSVAVQGNGAGTATLTVNSGGNPTLYLDSCFIGNLFTTAVAVGSLFATDTYIQASALVTSSGTQAFMVNCTWNTGTGVNNGQQVTWLGGYINNDFTFTGNQTFVLEASMTGNVTISGAASQVFITNTGQGTNLSLSSQLTIRATGVWALVTFSGANTNGSGFWFAHTFEGQALRLDMQGQCKVDAVITATNGTGATFRGGGHNARLLIQYACVPGIALIGCRDSVFNVDFAPDNSAGAQGYTIDATSNRNLLVLGGFHHANMTTASTDAGANNAVVDNLGSPPTGTATGDLTGSYPGPTVGTNKISNAKLAQMAANSIKGNNTGGVANALDLTTSQVQTLLSIVAKDTLWVNVKDHGAVGDGATDDTAAIQAALTAANWPTSKAVLYFPAGDYLISSSITLDGAGASSTPQLTLFGLGATISTVSAITMFLVTNSVTSITRVRFEGLLIKPNATGAVGISFVNSEFCSVVNCEFLGSGGTAITFPSGTSNYTGIYGCTFSNLASGIVFTAPAHFTTISNCNFAEGFAGTGITCWVDVPTSAGISNGVRINGCVFRGVSATKPVINVIAGVNWTITGNAFFDCALEAILLGTNGNAKNVAITGCTFQKGLQNDITINGGRLNSITGCLFGNRGTGVAASTFVNVRIKNTFGGAAGANNVVTGCTSEDTGTALLGFAQLDAGCVSCAFIGNFYSIAISASTSAPVIIDPVLVSIPINVDVSVIGQGLKVKEGTNAKQGIATMAAGTVVVGNTSVTANSRIMLTVQVLGTVAAPKAVAVTARTAGTNFTITSSDATDTSQVAWEIFEPG